MRFQPGDWTGTAQWALPPGGRLFVAPAYRETEGDQAVITASPNDLIALRVVPETDYELRALSRFVSSISAAGAGTLEVYSEGLAIEPNGALNPGMDKFHADQSGPSSPLHVTATSSDPSGNYDGWKAYDGNTSTWWKSGAKPATTPQEIEIDLGPGNAVRVNKVALVAADETNTDLRAFPKQFTVQLKEDGGASYDTVLSVTASVDPRAKGMQTYGWNIGSKSYRYLKLRITDNHGAGEFTCVGEIRWIAARNEPAPGAFLQTLGSLESGTVARRWTRLEIPAQSRFQLQRGRPVWIVERGASGASYGLSMRRGHTGFGSMFPDGAAAKYSLDGGLTWSQCLQDGKPALWNMIVNPGPDDTPQLGYGRFSGPAVFIPEYGLVSIPECGVFLNCAGLQIDATYYVYGGAESGALSLHASQSPPVAAHGVELMSGDETKRLLGIIHTKEFNGFAVPVDVMDRRLTINRHNRLRKRLGKLSPYSSATGETVNSATGPVWRPCNKASHFRVEFLGDGMNAVASRFYCFVWGVDAGASYVSLAFAMDNDSTPHDDSCVTASGSNWSRGVTELTTIAREGFHYLLPIRRPGAAEANTFVYYHDPGGLYRSAVTGWIEA
jgi:hypothetical protein